MWFEELSDLDRQTYLLAKAYEAARQDRGQRGYVCFEFVPAMTDNRVFKTFRTITKWMVDRGWRVSVREDSYKAYVQFVFDNFSTIPQPGQLRNLKLLKAYLRSAPKNLEVPARSDAEMVRLYRKILIKEARPLYGV